MKHRRQAVRHLVLVLGDQLDHESAAFDGFDPDSDLVFMAEAFTEATHVWSNKHRIAFFFSAMRHFAQELESAGRPVRYLRLGEGGQSLGDLIGEAVEQHAPERVICVQPGEWRVIEVLERLCRKAGVELEVREDRHFLDTPGQFREWAEGRKEVRLEYYYREMRKRHDILMTPEGKPEGGGWNFDKENRGAFGKKGPDPGRPQPLGFEPDGTTREVIRLVEDRFGGHPGNLVRFSWAVTREQALAVLDDFIRHRLPLFGDYQDAMWTGEPFLYHSMLSAALNVKLLNPREVIERAVNAWNDGHAPLNAVEGFVRQILGWREYVRGIYWWKMPGYIDRNALAAEEPLPGFYWTGETPYTCLREAIGQTLEYGYAHHIQRLMVTGLYGLLLAVNPKAMHEWYLAVYIDAVEWVELPNTLGMSQFGDGGLMASKPYAATGKYIRRMSNYCASCPANPDKATGPEACPFTTLYWDFLRRHRDRLGDNRRLALQLKNIDRKGDTELRGIRQRADAVRRDPSGRELFR